MTGKVSANALQGKLQLHLLPYGWALRPPASSCTVYACRLTAPSLAGFGPLFAGELWTPNKSQHH
jgi:hypothetical protein